MSKILFALAFFGATCRLTSASEISAPQIDRTSSQLSVRFNAQTAGEYRVHTSRGILCRYGDVRPGENRIYLPKVTNNEDLRILIDFPESGQKRSLSVLTAKAKPYFSPLRKLDQAAAIYQLPLRTYLAKGLGRQNTGQFRHLSKNVLREIRALGIDYLWLTGVLEHAHASQFDPDVIKGQAGSYYAVADNWDVSSDLGGLDEFDALIKRIHSAGLRVLIDFIPNHTARTHRTDVECKHLLNFGRGDRVDTFFHPQNNYFYLPQSDGHFIPPYQMGWPGTDGVFDTDIFEFGVQHELPAKATGNNLISNRPPMNAWFETVKLNYGYNFLSKEGVYSETPKTWKIMLDIARYWAAKGVDGFRVDFAHSVPIEFWRWFAKNLRSYQPNIFLLAEAYEQDIGMKVPGFSYEALLAAGFDSIYNSQLYWSLRKQSVQPGSVYEANFSRTPAARPYLRERGLLLTNYIENHDELRVVHEEYAPLLNSTAERMRNGWAQFTYSALMPAHVMIHGGQEFGEDASVVGPFAGNNGRTSIFDYVYQARTLSWLQGKLPVGAAKLREAYRQVLHLKHHTPFISRHSDSLPSFIDLLPANAGKEQNKWVGSYLRFDNERAFLVVSNLDPLREHSVTIHFTPANGQDPLRALRSMRVKNNGELRYKFVEVMSRRGWSPNDPNISGLGIPGSVLYRSGGVPSGFFIGSMPARSTYIFAISAL